MASPNALFGPQYISSHRRLFPDESSTPIEGGVPDPVGKRGSSSSSGGGSGGEEKRGSKDAEAEAAGGAAEGELGGGDVLDGAAGGGVAGGESATYSSCMHAFIRCALFCFHRRKSADVGDHTNYIHNPFLMQMLPKAEGRRKLSAHAGGRFGVAHVMVMRVLCGTRGRDRYFWGGFGCRQCAHVILSGFQLQRVGSHARGWGLTPP